MLRKALVTTTVAVGSAVALATTAFAGDGRGPMGFRRGGRHPILAIVGLVLLAAAIAALVVLLVKRPWRQTPVAPPAAQPQPQSPTAGAEAILAERLARSEISPDDYRLMLAALRGGEPAPAPTTAG